MAKCSPLQRRIKTSIAAIVVLFLLGGMVLGSSLMWFDFKLKHDAMPRSMTEEHRPVPASFDSALWYVLLLVCAGVGLPLGMHVLHTLHDAEDHVAEQNQTIL